MHGFYRGSLRSTRDIYSLLQAQLQAIRHALLATGRAHSFDSGAPCEARLVAVVGSKACKGAP
eukprot:14058-Eustigmatos_ZCMA.PRE.1